MLLLPHDAMLAQYLPSSCDRLSVRPSVHYKPVLNRNDWTNRVGFWHGDFFSIYPTLFYKEIEYLKQKLEYFLLEFCPKLQTEKILPRPVDRVVNKIRRRRRRSRLLTTSIRQSRRLVAVYNKSVNCNPSTPLLRFVLDYIDLFTTSFYS